MERKLTMKEKAQYIWDKHKGKIIFIGTLLGIGIYCAAKARNEHPESEAQTEKPQVGGWDQKANTVLIDIPAKETEESRNEKAEQTFEEKQADPERKMDCGGWVLEDDTDDKECPMMIANDVPISALGEFGQELIKRAEGKDLGRFNQDLEKAWTSIIINLEAPCAQEELNEPATDEAAA